MANSCSDQSPNTLVMEVSPDSRIICSAKCCAMDQANSFTSTDSLAGCLYKQSPDIVSRSYNITLKVVSPAASSGPFCRICHEGDYHEDLVSLCKCSGSVGLFHLSCMERWLSTRRSTNDKCEICNFTFETIRSPKSLLEWYKSDQGCMGNRHGVLGDIACFSLITPLAAVSAFLCFEGAKRQVRWNNSLEAGCLMALATFLITIYIVWIILTFRYHSKSYLRWRSVNHNVRLVRYRRKSTDADMGNQHHVNMTPARQSRPTASNNSQESTAPFAQTQCNSESANVTDQSSNLGLTDNS